MSANFDERLAPSPAETSPPEAGAEPSTATADERSARALLAQADVILHERAAACDDRRVLSPFFGCRTQ